MAARLFLPRRGPTSTWTWKRSKSRITARTAALIINSPNNPTGRIYPEETLRSLAGMLEAAGRKRGRPIYLLSDEPYRKLAYDGAKVPGIMRLYPHSIVVTSYSKDLSLPGRAHRVRRGEPSGG